MRSAPRATSMRPWPSALTRSRSPREAGPRGTRSGADTRPLIWPATRPTALAAFSTFSTRVLRAFAPHAQESRCSLFRAHRRPRFTVHPRRLARGRRRGGPATALATPGTSQSAGRSQLAGDGGNLCVGDAGRAAGGVALVDELRIVSGRRRVERSCQAGSRSKARRARHLAAVGQIELDAAGGRKAGMDAAAETARGRLNASKTANGHDIMLMSMTTMLQIKGIPDDVTASSRLAPRSPACR